MIPPKTRRRIERQLRDWDNPNSAARKRFEAAKKRLDREFKPLEDAIKTSTHLTADDYAVTINAR